MKVEANGTSVEFDGALITLAKQGGWPLTFELREVKFVEFKDAEAHTDGSLTFHLDGNQRESLRFSRAKRDEFRQFAVEVDDARRKGSSKVIVTTGFLIPGREIVEVVDVITSEAAIGMNIFKDIANAWRDAVGGRSKSIQGILREARELCLVELRREAETRFADAVIGVDLHYTEFSSGMVTGGMVMVVATGTAVRLQYQS